MPQIRHLHMKKFPGKVADVYAFFSHTCFVQVETYGSMEKKEKVEFILEQMRLCIAVKDYIRTQIISKKINTKFFQEEGTEVKKQELAMNKQKSIKNLNKLRGDQMFFCI